MKRIRFPVDREAVAASMRDVILKSPLIRYDPDLDAGNVAWMLAGYVMPLLTLPMDEEGLADAAYDGMQAGNNDGHGRGSFLACWTGCALAVLTAAGFVVDDE